MKVTWNFLTDRPFFQPRFAADGGNGGGGSGAGSSSEPDPSKVQTDPPGKTTPETPALTAAEIAALQAEHTRLLNTHLEMKAKYVKREEADAKAREDALKSQGEFKTLYETAKAENDTLKAKVTDLERYKTVVGKYLETEMKAIPEKDREVIPEGDEVAKLEWIAKAKLKGFFGGSGQKPAARGDGSPLPGDTKTKGLGQIFKTK